MKNYLLLSAIFILLSLNSHANESTKTHESLLNTALTVYNQCFPGDTMYGSFPNATERVIEGNIAMDEGLKFSLFDWSSLNGDDVFSKADKKTKWCFYNPNQNKQSCDRLFQELQDGIDNNDKNFDKLLFIGGIINLVEDISIVEHNNITLTKPDSQRVYNELLYDNVLCNDIDMDTKTVEEIRNNTASQTLSILKEEIPGCQGIKWQEFWIKTNKSNNLTFGKTGLLRAKNGSTCEFKKDDSRYKDFIYSLHLNAIHADLQLLNWSTKNILKRDKKLKF